MIERRACDPKSPNPNHKPQRFNLHRMEVKPMAIVTEISWNDMFAGKVLPDSPARKAFREAVEAVADKARAKLPELNTRVDKAIQAVLNGDVSIDADGQGKIASQTNGKVEYLVGKGDGCVCK